MTADIDIVTSAQHDVLYVPIRSVVFADGGSYVHVYEGGVFKKVTVVTGLRGSEGMVEIVSGLHEGQEIVLYSDSL